MYKDYPIYYTSVLIYCIAFNSRCISFNLNLFGSSLERLLWLLYRLPTEQSIISFTCGCKVGRGGRAVPKCRRGRQIVQKHFKSLKPPLYNVLGCTKRLFGSLDRFLITKQSRTSWPRVHKLKRTRTYYNIIITI